ncbi:MAG: FecR domain-containing protein [Candidatus Methylacidiphilales bacterium]|nr:FecR domain-containing protein [Candidatus Methylacidiphilales bacterium]
MRMTKLPFPGFSILAAWGLSSLSFLTGLQAAPLKEANLTRIVNDVRIMELPANVQKPALLNQKVIDQQAVVTGLQSRAELLFSDKTLTRLGANSVFTFKEGTRNMDLKRGTMLLQVPKNAGGAQIKTAAVTAAITGTTLLVEYQPGAGPSPQTFPSADLSTPVPPLNAVAAAPASDGSGAVASNVEGTTRILVPGESTFRPLRAGESIPAGSSLMTAESGSAVVSPAPGVALRLLPNSILRVDAAEGDGKTPKVRLNLKEGGVINIISKAKYNQVDYQITTPQGVCAARGTVFGIFVSGGRVLVLGAHGASAFNGQPVPAGRASFFGSGRSGNLDPNSPEFRRLLGQTVDALRSASDRGLIPPSFLPQVRDQLERGGVRLDESQKQQLQPPQSQGQGGNTGPQVAGGGNGAGSTGGDGGFAKVVVLEGEVRVFITGQVGESMLLQPGQMIIFPPNTTRLPEAVDVNLDLLVKTSKLVQEMDPNDGALVADQGGAVDPTGGSPLNLDPVQDAIGGQQQLIDSGLLGDTNLIILSGDSAIVLTPDQLTAIQNATNAGTPPPPVNLNPALLGPLTTISGLNTLDASTLVSTNPTITQGNATYEGKIMTGRPGDDLAASKAEYLFGAESPFDQFINFQANAPTPSAIFRFANLTIAGPFPISTAGANAQSTLGLVSEGNLAINLASQTLSLSPLSGGFFLITKDGNIQFNNGTLDVGGREAFFLARDGNTLGDYNGSGGDITFSATSVITGTSGGSFGALAQNNLTYSGSSVGLTDFDLAVGTGNLVYNGNVQSGRFSLFAENGGVTNGPGTPFLSSSPVIQLNGGTVNASNIEIGGFDVQFNNTALAATSTLRVYSPLISLNGGSFESPSVELNSTDLIEWGGVSFLAANPSLVKFFAEDITLLQSQFITNPNLKVELELGGGTLSGPFQLSGIRKLSGFGAVNGLTQLWVNKGSIDDFSGNIFVTGGLAAFDGGIGGEGRINVQGDLSANQIYADGDIFAFNINAVNGVTANGTTSSISTGNLTVTGTGANVLARGTVQTNRITAPNTTITANSVQIQQAGNSTAFWIKSNSIQGSSADLDVDFISPNPQSPNTGNIQLNRLSSSGGINFAGINPGNNGYNLNLNILDASSGLGFGNSGSDILYAKSSGADNPSGPGGNGAVINITSPKVKVSSGGGILSEGGSSGIGTFNGGSGGQIILNAAQGFDMNGGLISVAGGNASVTGGEGGNGGSVQISSSSNMKLQGAAKIDATAGAAGGVTPISSQGGSIQLTATGAEIEINGSNLATSDKTNTFTKASQGGLIKLISNIAYGSSNPTSNRAVYVRNSSELYAMTHMANLSNLGTIDLQATGNNASVVIDNATLRADIVKLGAINSNGNLVIGGSTIEASSLMKLYGGTTAGNGVIFVANTNLDGSGVKYIRGQTVTINNGVTVNVTGPAAQVFTNVANYSAINGGNGNTTGLFTGSGATTQPLANAPSF